MSGIASDLAHLRDAAEVSAPIHPRRHAVHFEVFESLFVFFHTDRRGSIFCLAVLLPASSRLQDVAVGVHRPRILQLVNLFFS